MKRIERQWLLFRALIVSKGAGPNQIEGSRVAFYAGAGAMWGQIFSLLDSEAEATEGDLVKLDELQQELDEFISALRRGDPA